jgi:PAS domain S-box-containing protein
MAEARQNVDTQENPTSQHKDPQAYGNGAVSPVRAPAGGEALYHALFDLLPSSVVLLDLAGTIRDVNPAFCRWMGYSKEELVGTHVTRFSNEKPADIEQNLQRIRAGELLEHEVVNRQKDGSLRHYEIRERAVDLPDGTRGILVVSNDITDRKAAEAERLQLERDRLRAQKLESLGVLAGGIAHDFNNLLTIIIGHLDLASGLLPQKSPVHDSLREISHASRRAAELTRQMLAYSGGGRFVTRPVQLGELLAESLQHLQLSISPRIRLDLRIGDGHPGFPADPAQIAQVLKSILINASEAVPETGGILRVSVGSGEFDAATLSKNRTDQPMAPGHYAVLEIADNGAGMTEEVQQRMFDPFFSTKFPGRGLGMAAVLGIVRGHHGAILVESAPQRGTTVRVLFPVPREEVEPVRQQPDPPAQIQPPPSDCFSGTVLIVEDEDAVRLLLEKLLQGLGLRAVSAPNGELAVDLFGLRHREIAFAILDLTLPGMSGVETLARLRQQQPELKAVLTSGYERGAIKGYQNEAGFIDFIQKPCDIATFRRVITSVCTRLGLPASRS